MSSSGDGHGASAPGTTGNEAALVDPQRDCRGLLAACESRASRVGTPLVLVLPEPEREAAEQAAIQLMRIGYEDIGGYLQGGVDRWHDSGRTLIELVSADVSGVALGVQELSADLLTAEAAKVAETARLVTALIAP
jgi:hypothetical protein